MHSDTYICILITELFIMAHKWKQHSVYQKELVMAPSHNKILCSHEKELSRAIYADVNKCPRYIVN